MSRLFPAYRRTLCLSIKPCILLYQIGSHYFLDYSGCLDIYMMVYYGQQDVELYWFSNNSQVFLYVISSDFRLLSCKIGIPQTMISILGSARYRKAVPEMKSIRYGNILMREDVFWCLITILIMLLIGVILIVLMIECLIALLRQSLIQRGMSRKPDLSCLIKRLFFFLVDKESTGLLSNSDCNAIFSYFFFAFFPCNLEPETC